MVKNLGAQSPTDGNKDREEERKRYFLDLKTSQVLKTHGKSKYVHLMSDGCIKKRYDSTIPDHEDHFRREVKILRHLANWPHSPSILWVNWKKRTIYMSYCGPNPQPSPKVKAELARLMEELRNDWGLFRLDLEGKTTDHIDVRNICTEKDKLYLIDFGSPLWELRA